MTFFFVGVGIFVLLIASYSQRDAWVTCCSTMMSIAALVGWLLIPTVEDHGKVPAGLAWLFAQLPLVLDQQTLDDLTAVIARGSIAAICDAKTGPGCATAASHTALPIARGNEFSQSSAPSEADEPNQAGETVDRLLATTIAEDASGSPVTWLLDEPTVVSDGVPRFLISGINVSNVALKKVHATLKPDPTQREVALALDVPGNKLHEDSIPVGARFTLRLDIPATDDKKKVAGAIFAFRYTYAGRQKATIWYLTPTMMSRFAKLD